MTERTQSRLPLRDPALLTGALTSALQTTPGFYMSSINATASLLASSEGFENFAPQRPAKMAQGMLKSLYQFQQITCDLTGLAAASLVPLSVQQAEFAALSMVMKYHQHKRHSRNLVLLCGELPQWGDQAQEMGLRVQTLQTSALSGQLSDQVAAVVYPASVLAQPALSPHLIEDLNKLDIPLFLSGAGRHHVIDELTLQVDLMTLDMARFCDIDMPCLAVLASEKMKPYLPVPFAAIDEMGQYEWQTQQQNPFSIGRLNAGVGNVSAILQCLVKMRLLGSHALQLQAQKAVASATYMAQSLKGSVLEEVICRHQSCLAGGNICFELKYSQNVADMLERCFSAALHQGVGVDSHFIGEAENLAVTLSRLHYLSLAQLDRLAADMRQSLSPFVTFQE